MDTFGVTECSEPLALVVHLVKPSPSGVLDVFRLQPLVSRAFQVCYRIHCGPFIADTALRACPRPAVGCIECAMHVWTTLNRPFRSDSIHVVQSAKRVLLTCVKGVPACTLQVFSRPALEHAAGRSYSYGHSHSTQAGVKNEPDWGSPGAGGTSACQPFSPNGVYSRTGSLDRTSSERNSARSSGSVRVRTLPPKARRSSNSSGPRSELLHWHLHLMFIHIHHHNKLVSSLTRS